MLAVCMPRAVGLELRTCAQNDRHGGLVLIVCCVRETNGRYAQEALDESRAAVRVSMRAY
jgi:hypothetical protein